MKEDKEERHDDEGDGSTHESSGLDRPHRRSWAPLQLQVLWVTFLGSMTLVSGVLLFMPDGPARKAVDVTLAITVGTLLAVGVGGLLIAYLSSRSVIIDTARDFGLYSPGDRLHRLIEHRASLERNLKEHEPAVRSNSRDVLSGTSEPILLSENERAELLEKIAGQVQRSLVADVIREVEKSVHSASQRDGRMQFTSWRYDRLKIGIEEAIGRVEKRGNINLLVGFFFSVVAVGVLAFSVAGSVGGPVDWSGFIPRAVLALFVQLFAYFFLRLYRQSLADARYFQNELTNLGIWFTSLELALAGDSDETADNILRQLATVERNFVLKIGESTIDGERLRSEQALTLEGLRAAAKVVGQSK